MDLQEYKQRLVDLAQKWRTGWITDAKYQELDSWYRLLEDTPLGPPIEFTVDKLEKNLNNQLYKNMKLIPTPVGFNLAKLLSGNHSTKK